MWASELIEISGLTPEQYVRKLERAERDVLNRIKMARVGAVQNIQILTLTLLLGDKNP